MAPAPKGDDSQGTEKMNGPVLVPFKEYNKHEVAYHPEGSPHTILGFTKLPAVVPHRYLFHAGSLEYRKHRDKTMQLPVKPKVPGNIASENP